MSHFIEWRVLGGWEFAPQATALRLSSTPGGVSNTQALGRLIYTDYIFLFQAAGLILMVVMKVLGIIPERLDALALQTNKVSPIPAGT